MPPWRLPQGLTEADIDAAEGFIYTVTRRDTGRSYVGKKWTRMKRGKKRLISKWRTYWSSCEELLVEIKQLGHDAFDREIILVCDSQSLTNYEEVAEMMRRDVLRAKLPDGSPAYYNRNVFARWYAGRGCMKG